MSAFSHRHRLWLALALVVFLFLLAWGYTQRQGPELPAYRLEEAALQQRVVASGEVSSSALARIGSEVTGVVKARHVREGDAVKPGDLLLELRDESAAAAVAELEAALRQLSASARPQAQAVFDEAESALKQSEAELARRELLRERQLLAVEALEQARNAVVAARAARDRARLQLTALAADGSEAAQLRARLAAARAALEKTRIRATFAGTVQSRAIEPGDLVQPGSTLLTVSPAQSREVVLAVDEKIISPLALGQSAEIVADAYPQRVVRAQLSFMAPAVNAENGTLKVHLQLLEAADFLRQGMTVSATIYAASRERALVLPNDALFEAQADDSAVVYRLREGRVQKLKVKLGLRGIAGTEVVSGLQAGDVVVAAEAEDGRRARVKLQALPVSLSQAQSQPAVSDKQPLQMLPGEG